MVSRIPYNPTPEERAAKEFVQLISSQKRKPSVPNRKQERRKKLANRSFTKNVRKAESEKKERQQYEGS